MSEWTEWTAANLTPGGSVVGSNWNDLTNAETPSPDFAFAVATNGTWAGSPGHVTEIIDVAGRSTLDPLIPDNATIDRVEVRLYYTLPVSLTIVPDVRVYKSDSSGSHGYEQLLLTIGPAAESDIANYGEDITNSAGRAIAQGGLILPVFGYHEDDEGVSFQLNWTYSEFRLRFTRAPNVPRTAYVALF